MKTNLNFHCNTDKVGALSVLLFLQPVDAESTTAKNYLYFAWENFHPAQGSHNTVPLVTDFSASVGKFVSPFDQYTDPYGLTLGNAQVVTNISGSDPFFTSKTNSIEKELVGVYNACTDPGTDLSVVWYINGGKVVQTNNTEETALHPNLYSSFELKQSLYCMFGNYSETQTYAIQTFSNMTMFKIPNDASDMYFEIDYDPNSGLFFKQTKFDDYVKTFPRHK